LLEAERNLSRQPAPASADTYHTQLATTPLTIVPIPLIQRGSVYASIVGEKDAHVLAAALVGNADFLLTLDKQLAARVTQANLSVRALSPGDFVTAVLPEHQDYRAIR
jgi:predicted nucleic acid-binding protein